MVAARSQLLGTSCARLATFRHIPLPEASPNLEVRPSIVCFCFHGDRCDHAGAQGKIKCRRGELQGRRSHRLLQRAARMKQQRGEGQLARRHLRRHGRRTALPKLICTGKPEA